MIVIIVKEYVMSDDKVILIKILRKKEGLRKNKERKTLYTLYFFIIFLRIVELLSILFFRSQHVSCWIDLLHLVHAPRIERKTLREVVLSITNKRIKESWRKRIKRLHKVTQSHSSILRHKKESQQKMVTQWLHKPQKLNQVQHQLRQTFKRRLHEPQ